MKLKDFKMRTDLACTPKAAPAPAAPPAPKVPEVNPITYTRETGPTFVIDNVTLIKKAATGVLFQYQVGTDPEGNAVTVTQIVDNKLTFEDDEEIIVLAVGSVYSIAGRMTKSQRLDEATGVGHEKSKWVMLAIESV